jgi:hypothetical protein
MYETDAELHALQELLDRSHRVSTEHVRSIVTPERRLDAADLVHLLTGMKVLGAATVTAAGEPRISALDGHFLHATWMFGTDDRSAKARQLRARPAVSVAHIDGERLAVFSHGRVETLQPGHPQWDGLIEHWTRHYGAAPSAMGDHIVMYALRAHWMVGFAVDRSAVLPESG